MFSQIQISIADFKVCLQMDSPVTFVTSTEEGINV